MKKFISILLAVLLLASAAVVSANAYSVWEDVVNDDGDMVPNQSVSEAVAAYEASTGEKVEVFRYYFQMPDGTNGPVGADGKKAPSWIHDGINRIKDDDGNITAEYCGMYYWATGSYPTPKAWAGYKAEKLEGVPNVWYADVPGAVLTIIWNNGVDGGNNPTDPDDPDDIYFKAAQTDNLKIEYLDPGDDDDFPDGLGQEDVPGAFANMIFIINPDKVDINEYSLKQTCGGRWYFYLGDGCYAATADGDCCNPDHFDEAGNHVGYQEPTEPATDAPTEPGPAKILGDVDGDGVVSVLDATKIQKFKASILTADDIDVSLEVADVDGDGVVSVMDATRIQKFKAKIMNLDGTTPYVEA